ncbi:hypothetical protein ES702_04525 [subsurface metagenome]
MKRDITDKELSEIARKKRKELKKEGGKKTRLREGEFQSLPRQYTAYPNHRLDAYNKHVKTLTQLKILNWLVRNSWGKRGSGRERIRWVKLPTYKELGKQLNVSATQVYLTLKELKRIELIREDDRGRIGIWRLFPRKTE